jgi:hypothetical protein
MAPASSYPKGGFGEHTFAQADGPGFVHVSYSGRSATLACSTEMSLMSCFSMLIDKINWHKSLMKTMTGTDAHSLAQQSHSQNLIEHSRFIGDSGELAKLLNVPSDVVALRLDVGGLSWQWDDISSPNWPNRRSFGGLADISSIVALGSVLRDIADDWPRKNGDLFERAYEFLYDNLE